LSLGAQRNNKNELEQIERPQAQLNDLVLPPDLLGRIRRFVDSARAHGTVLTEWGLGRSLGNTSGLTAIFSGASGTGKSMAAEAIASALDRPLLRCPLSTVMSKWVGETSKNIAQLFQTAREHRAVLLFDEADALFARRVNVRSSNDRFANAETGALLTQLERHSGVVILTTNCVEEIDSAFERRLQLRLTFPFPDSRARTALWKQMLGQDTPLAPEVNVAQLGRAFELSGALIRNAVLSAALEAAIQPAGSRVLTKAMLERAAAEQLKSPAGEVVVLSAMGSA
jgi:SpoVK/Ycf46/Vps4 family AAA+-type ATPase